MNRCLCNRLYRQDKPTAVHEYAFSGSLNRVREFETLDGSRYCLTVFSLADYKHLHFPHEEYKELACKLHRAVSQQTSAVTKPEISSSSSPSQIAANQIPCSEDFELKFQSYRMRVGPITAFGIVKTAPFERYNTVDANKHSSMLSSWMSKYDICICGSCEVFKRLIDFELYQTGQYNAVDIPTPYIL